MLKFRSLTILSVVIITALVLAACGGGGNTQPTPATGEQPPVTGDEGGEPAVPEDDVVQPPADPGAAEDQFEGEPAPSGTDLTEVRLATWAGVTEATELQEIIDELNANSDSYWIVQQSSPSEYWTVLQTTLAGGTAADMFWVDQEHLPDLALRGALMDISEQVNVSDHPAAQLDDYFESAIDAFRFQGQLYGLPWIGMPVMLYINLDYLEEAGLSEEDVNNWTWEDFRSACIQLTRDANGNTAESADFDAGSVRQYGFSIVPGWPPVQQFIWQAGGDIISEDGTQVLIDSPEAVEGAQFIAELANEARCTPAQSVISERGFGEMMNAGQVAMFMGGAADDFERTEGMNIKGFLLPQGPVNRDSWAYIGGMGINSQAADPELAYEAFIDLTQAIQEWKVPSPRQSLATREGIIEAAPYKEVSADNIIANMENMRAPVIFPGYAEWSTIFGERYVDPLVRGSSDAQTLGTEVRPLLEDQMQRSMERQ